MRRSDPNGSEFRRPGKPLNYVGNNWALGFAGVLFVTGLLVWATLTGVEQINQTAIEPTATTGAGTELPQDRNTLLQEPPATNR